MFVGFLPAGLLSQAALFLHFSNSTFFQKMYTKDDAHPTVFAGWTVDPYGISDPWKGTDFAEILSEMEKSFPSLSAHLESPN